jgi:release factor glutamine methyltransferase
MSAAASHVAGPTLRELLAEATAVLGSVTEARWVLERATGLDAAALATSLGEPAAAGVADDVLAMAARRAGGEPLQYVLGSWPFRTLELSVDPRVLIPRPETEAVVEIALGVLADAIAAIEAAVPERPVMAVDLGTGTGAVALSLVAEGPEALVVWGVDRSADALEVARANLAGLIRRRPELAGRVQLAQGHWFGALPVELAHSMCLVVANPPYVAAGEWDGLDPVVRDHEPRGALVSGPTGLEDVTAIVEQAGTWLAPGAGLVMEIAPHQSGPARAAATAAGFRQVRVQPDLTGRDRALVCRWPG